MEGKKNKMLHSFQIPDILESPGTGFPELQLPVGTGPTIIFFSFSFSLKDLNGLRKIGSSSNWFEQIHSIKERLQYISF